jgi:hypothetical protein
MEEISSVSGPVNISEENVVDLIRNCRNEIIKDFLDERNIRAYFFERYHVHDLASAKVDLIKHDLKELLIAPVDTQHYAHLIDWVKQGGIISLDNVDFNPDVFYKEMQHIFLKYMF